MSAECDHCGAETQYRVIVVELGIGKTKQFCSDGCKGKWIEKDYIRLRRFLNRIYCTARGLARDVARIALTTNQPL